MANYVVSDTTLAAVADAIRTKGGTSAQLSFPQGFVDAIAAIETGGGNSIYMSQYTTTGDVTIATFLSAINYEVHSDNCLLLIRSNGTTAPTSGNYTLNNYTVGFNNGVVVNGADYYATGKRAPKTLVAFPGANEQANKFLLDNGVLKSNYTGTSCIAGAGAVVTVVEIDLPSDFWSVLNADTLL